MYKTKFEDIIPNSPCRRCAVYWKGGTVNQRCRALELVEWSLILMKNAKQNPICLVLSRVPFESGV